jgi:hypothetical protein
MIGLIWVWADDEPPYWAVDKSADGETGWASVATVAGNLRDTVAPDGGGFYRVWGKDGSEIQQTGFSNAVYVGSD